jgi:hypothetical protein
MKILNFFKEVPGSIKGYLNSQELIRILFLTLAAGGGMEMMLSSLRASMNQLLVNPQNAAWVSAVIVALMEINRRLKQGDLPVVSEGSNDTKVSG